MREIDQSPKDYRAGPVKGEPVFVPGGLRRLASWFIGLAISLAISIPLYLLIYPPISALVDWILGR